MVQPETPWGDRLPGRRVAIPAGRPQRIPDPDTIYAGQVLITSEPAKYIVRSGDARGQGLPVLQRRRHPLLRRPPLSVAIVLVSIVAAMSLADRVYAGGVLHSDVGGSSPLRKALRSG